MISFLKSKWTPLFLANFLGVFNDNLLKNAIIFIAISWWLPSWLTTSQLISIVSGSLILPYLILSPYAGKLSVRYSKKKVFRFFKTLEMPIMILVGIAFYYQWIYMAVFTVLLMGIQSCLYSPSKYSLIRDIGGENGVSFGSGIFEMMAFLGILLGAVVASLIADYYHIALLVGLFMLVAVVGYLVTRQIKADELAVERDEFQTVNPFLFIIRSYRFAREIPKVNIAVFGASMFWLIAAMLQMNLIIHSQKIYNSSNLSTGFVMATAAIGIGVGCWGHRISFKV